MNKKLKPVLLVSANIVLFYLFFSWLKTNIDSDKFFDMFASTPLKSIVIATAIGLFILLCYGKRLSFLIKRPASASFKIAVVSFGINNLLPFRLGDGVALAYAKNAHSLPIVSYAWGKFVEKYIDLGFVFLCGLIGVWLGKNHFSVLQDSYLQFLILFSCISVMLLLFVVFMKSGLLTRLVGNISWLRNAIASVLTQVSGKDILHSVTWSCFIWSFTVLLMYLFFSTALPDYQIRVEDALILVFLTTISLGIPSTPSGFGLFEGVVVFYLTTFKDISNEEALASALVLHITMALPQILIALAILSYGWLFKVHLRSATRVEESQ